jgi:hypothetical protein
MLDTGCWMLDAGYWMLDTGCWVLDTGYWILDSGCWIPASGCREPDTGWGTMAGTGLVAGLKSGQSNRKRNFEKANTRLPCIVRWVTVIIDLKSNWFNLSHTAFKALRAGRIMNIPPKADRRKEFCRFLSVFCHPTSVIWSLNAR